MNCRKKGRDCGSSKCKMRDISSRGNLNHEGGAGTFREIASTLPFKIRFSISFAAHESKVQ